MPSLAPYLQHATNATFNYPSDDQRPNTSRQIVSEQGMKSVFLNFQSDIFRQITIKSYKLYSELVGHSTRVILFEGHIGDYTDRGKMSDITSNRRNERHLSLVRASTAHVHRSQAAECALKQGTKYKLQHREADG
jgi:hypothetical protein